ncbi:MAG: XylR N-terminal domain-containing protein, partial [Noviherbaspirillum sp.]
MSNPLSLLRFNTESGHIWLDENRMLLVHARALAALRKELFNSLGVERARGLLVRMGFVSGERDGEWAARQRLSGVSTEQAFAHGPALHGIEGAVSVTQVALD